MAKGRHIDIDPDIVLDPLKVKGMPEELQVHLKAALSDASRRYECKVGDLTWKVGFDKKSGLPYINVKKK